MSLCTSPNSVLVTGVLLKASHMVRIFVTWRTSASAFLAASNVLQHITSPSAMLVKRFVKRSRDWILCQFFCCASDIFGTKTWVVWGGGECYSPLPPPPCSSACAYNLDSSPSQECVLSTSNAIIISNKKVSLSGSKIYVETQAFDSLSESLSSGVGRFVTWLSWLCISA